MSMENFSVIEQLKHIARGKQCYKVILDCNEPNQGFYEKLDFKRKEVQMAHYFEHWERDRKKKCTKIGLQKKFWILNFEKNKLQREILKWKLNLIPLIFEKLAHMLLIMITVKRVFPSQEFFS